MLYGLRDGSEDGGRRGADRSGGYWEGRKKEAGGQSCGGPRVLTDLRGVQEASKELAVTFSRGPKPGFVITHSGRPAR
jgi:hypothetical protein